MIFKDGHKSILHQGLLEPEFYGALVYKLKKIVGSKKFSAQFIKILLIIKRLAITSMYASYCMLGGQTNYGWHFALLYNCNLGVRLLTLRWSRLKDLSIDEMIWA